MSARDQAPVQPAGDDEDCSVIHPPNLLAAKAAKREGSLQDLLANAETMLSTMKQDFDELVDATLLELPSIYSQQWQPAASRPQALIAFKRTANTLKGKSGSFGFGLLGDVADLFRDYLTDVPPEQQKAAAILNYIDMLNVVWKQRISGDGGEIGRQIVANLVRLNEQALPGAKP
jgi:hypothetical protein